MKCTLEILLSLRFEQELKKYIWNKAYKINELRFS